MKDIEFKVNKSSIDIKSPTKSKNTANDIKFIPAVQSNSKNLVDGPQAPETITEKPVELQKTSAEVPSNFGGIARDTYILQKINDEIKRATTAELNITLGAACKLAITQVDDLVAISLKNEFDTILDTKTFSVPGGEQSVIVSGYLNKDTQKLVLVRRDTSEIEIDISYLFDYIALKQDKINIIVLNPVLTRGSLTIEQLILLNASPLTQIERANVSYRLSLRDTPWVYYSADDLNPNIKYTITIDTTTGAYRYEMLNNGLSAHINNTDIHVSTEEKKLLEQ